MYNKINSLIKTFNFYIITDETSQETEFPTF